jgi:hypothetical protein
MISYVCPIWIFILDTDQAQINRANRQKLRFFLRLNPRLLAKVWASQLPIGQFPDGGGGGDEPVAPSGGK